jgi:hypothetical protein
VSSWWYLNCFKTGKREDRGVKVKKLGVAAQMTPHSIQVCALAMVRHTAAHAAADAPPKLIVIIVIIQGSCIC